MAARASLVSCTKGAPGIEEEGGESRQPRACHRVERPLEVAGDDRMRERFRAAPGQAQKEGLVSAAAHLEPMNRSAFQPEASLSPSAKYSLAFL